jgi:cytochrome c oxidase cbb3-type subunit IV
MEITHEALVGFAKTFGLFYLIALSVAIAAYAFWPSNRSRFDKAKNSIMDDEDGPCR